MGHILHLIPWSDDQKIVSLAIEHLCIMLSSLFYLLLVSFVLPLVLAVETPTSMGTQTEPGSPFLNLEVGLSREGLTSRPSREGNRLALQPVPPPPSPPQSSLASRERQVICHEGVWDLQEYTKATQAFENHCRAIYDDLTSKSPLQRRTSRGDYWWYRRKEYCQVTVVLLPGEALKSALASQLRMQDSIWSLVLDAMRGILTQRVEGRGLGGYYYFDEEKAKFKVTIGESPPLMVYEEEDEQDQPLLGSQVTYRPSSATSCPSLLELVPPRQPGGMARLSPPIFRQSGGRTSLNPGSFLGQELADRNPSSSSLRLSQIESQTVREARGELQSMWSRMTTSLRECCNRLNCCGCCNSTCWNDPVTWAKVTVVVNMFAATMNAVGNSMNVAAAAQNLRAMEKAHPGCSPCSPPPPFSNSPGS